MICTIDMAHTGRPSSLHPHWCSIHAVTLLEMGAGGEHDRRWAGRRQIWRLEPSRDDEKCTCSSPSPLPRKAPFRSATSGGPRRRSRSTSRPVPCNYLRLLSLLSWNAPLSLPRVAAAFVGEHHYHVTSWFPNRETMEEGVAASGGAPSRKRKRTGEREKVTRACDRCKKSVWLSPTSVNSIG